MKKKNDSVQDNSSILFTTSVNGSFAESSASVPPRKSGSPKSETMKTPTVSEKLSSVQKREIVAILTVGCPRRTAARYVGCTLKDISRNAKLDIAFARQMYRAEANVEIEMMKSLYNAAKQEKNWRASSWILERRLPDEFTRQKAETMSRNQFRDTFDRLSEIICDALPTEKKRQEVLKRLADALDSLDQSWRQ